MFSINIYLKFALIAVFLIGGIVLAVAYGFWYSFPLLLIGIILLISYLLLGTVQSTAMLMQKADMVAAEKRLNLTLTPKLLFSVNRAYYYMLKGTIAVGNKDTEEGEKWLEKARSINLPSDNEKAMIELQLANIHGSKNRWKQAKLHFKAAKSLKKVTDPNVKEQLKQFEKALNNSGQLKAANRMGGKRGGGVMRPGGKRRRPKMR